jgi:hypothetical protein
LVMSGPLPARLLLLLNTALAKNVHASSPA